MVFREIRKWGNETFKVAVYVMCCTTYVVEIFVAMMTKDVLLCICTEKIMHLYKDLLLILLI